MDIFPYKFLQFTCQKYALLHFLIMLEYEAARDNKDCAMHSVSPLHKLIPKCTKNINADFSFNFKFYIKLIKPQIKFVSTLIELYLSTLVIRDHDDSKTFVNPFPFADV